MKSNEFEYWLKGYFALSKTQTLEVEQLSLIKTELQTVEKTDKKDTSAFCSWLTGYMEALGDAQLNPEQVLKIKNKLSATQPTAVVTPKPRLEALC